MVQIEGYTLLEKLDEGEEGALYKAVQLSLNRLVVVKLIFENDISIVENRIENLKLAASLRHPSIIKAVSFGPGNREYVAFVVMEYAGQQTLDSLLTHKSFSPDNILEYFQPILEALEEAHHSSLVHGCINPKNIFIDANSGEVKLAGLGYSRMRSRSVFAAPECSGNAKIDSSADTYSLTAIILNCFLGDQQFRAFPPELLSVDRQILQVAAAKSRLDAGRIYSFFEKGLAIEKGHRYQSASEMNLALKLAFAKKANHHALLAASLALVIVTALAVGFREPEPYFTSASKRMEEALKANPYSDARANSAFNSITKNPDYDVQPVEIRAEWLYQYFKRADKKSARLAYSLAANFLDEVSRFSKDKVDSLQWKNKIDELVDFILTSQSFVIDYDNVRGKASAGKFEALLNSSHRARIKELIGLANLMKAEKTKNLGPGEKASYCAIATNNLLIAAEANFEAGNKDNYERLIQRAKEASLLIENFTEAKLHNSIAVYFMRKGDFKNAKLELDLADQCSARPDFDTPTEVVESTKTLRSNLNQRMSQ